MSKINGWQAIKIDKYQYVDKEDDYYGVFGENTGFCYGLYGTKELAIKAITKKAPSDKD